MVRVPFEANCDRSRSGAVRGRLCVPGGGLILSVSELFFGGVSESKTSAVHCHARGARGPFAIHGHTSNFSIEL